MVALFVSIVAVAGAADAPAGSDHAAGTAEHGHAEHGHHAEIGHNPPKGQTREKFESPADFKSDLAIWSFAVFALLMAGLTAFAWKPIMEGLERRERSIADSIASAERANDEARRMLASYERRLAEASDEVRAMLEEARRDAESTKQTILAEARGAADEEKARARHEIGLARDEALSQIAERAGQLAVDVAGKFLRDRLSQEDQSRLIRDAVASIPATPSLN
jgi:F-type H+-transporting ATPase subunit b